MILIHGAMGCTAAVEPLAVAFRYYTDVTAPNLLGHGGRPIPERLAIGAMARDLLEQSAQAGIGRTFIAGYSFGATLALYLARHHPERIEGVCAIAPKVVFDARTVTHWTHLADPESLRRNGRALIHEKNHAPQDWVELTRVNRELFRGLGREPPLTAADLGAI